MKDFGIPHHSLLFLRKNPIFYAFLFTIIYWCYLFSSTRMTIQCDAINYERLGTILYQEGLLRYIELGPNQEPIYPFYISVSMRLAKVFSIPYYPIQRVFQLFILLSTQIISLKILRRLKIRDSIIALLIAYIGFSPGLVNSALILYSEIATYPFILGIAFWGHRSWIALHQTNKKFVFTSGLLLGLFFLLTTSIKGIFELIILVFLLPFFILALVSFIQKKKNIVFNTLILLLALTLTFFIPLNLYKFANKKLNGSFTFTNRGPYALYGNIARRSEKKAIQTIPVALSYAAGWGVCDAVYGEDACRFWSYKRSDAHGKGKMIELRRQGLSTGEIYKTLIHLAVLKFFQNPPQQILFMGIESIKMFFWETTKLGFVAYPDWLSKVFYWTPFKNGLRLLIAGLTLFGVVFSIIFLRKNRKEIFFSATPNNEKTLLFFIFYLILCYTLLHSFFFVITRLALVIAPLQLILIAFSLNSLIQYRLKHKKQK